MTMTITTTTRPPLLSRLTLLLSLALATAAGSTASASDWLTSTVDISRGFYNDLAFDLAGNPAVGYFDSGSDQVLLARGDGVTWNIEPVGSATAGTVSLAFDLAGNPAVAYGAGRDTLRFVRHDGARWLPPEDVDSKLVHGPSLAFDGQ